MKDKLVKIPFDRSVFEEKVHEQYLGYQGELQKTTDKKLELFIQVNYFHSVLDDSMEFLLKSKHARNNMKPHQIIRILFDRGILSDKAAKDAVKINQIRNFFTHGYDTPNIQPNAEKIINKITIDVPNNLASIETSKDLDMYQKLDWVIFDLVMNIENLVPNLRD